jgi:3-dehydroquinate synthase
MPTEELGYPVEVSSGAAALAKGRLAGPVALLYDQAVAGFAQLVGEVLEAEWDLALPGGEASKSLATYGQVLAELAQAGFPREGCLAVVGGGTLLDLGGFVAASYLRGISFMSFPTTTLAMVDAAVGGKTGINLAEGKNLVGSFYNPLGVYADLNALVTLPPQIFRAGMVEAFKHGLISGEPLLLSLPPESPATPGLEAYLQKAVAVKMGVVAQDFRESGARRQLNLGHTLAHALEAVSEHRYSHAESVAYGLLFAVLLGRALRGEDLVPQVLQFLGWLAPPPYPDLTWSELLPFIERDKKKGPAGVRWVIPWAAGNIEVAPVPEQILTSVYAEFLELV